MSHSVSGGAAQRERGMSKRGQRKVEKKEEESTRDKGTGERGGTSYRIIAVKSKKAVKGINHSIRTH